MEYPKKIVKEYILNKENTIILEIVLFDPAVKIKSGFYVSTEMVLYIKETKKVLDHSFSAEILDDQAIELSWLKMIQKIDFWITRNEGKYNKIKRIESLQK